MLLTIENDFHRTQATIRVKADMRASRRQIARAKQALCGIADCRCGWTRVVDAAGKRYDTEYNEDESVLFVEM